MSYHSYSNVGTPYCLPGHPPHQPLLPPHGPAHLRHGVGEEGPGGGGRDGPPLLSCPPALAALCLDLSYRGEVLPPQTGGQRGGALRECDWFWVSISRVLYRENQNSVLSYSGLALNGD